MLGVEAAIRDLGPAVIERVSSGVQVYPTFGSITISSEQMMREVFEDGHGDAPVDAVDMGTVVTIECDFTRLTNALLEEITIGGVAGANNLLKSNRAGNAQYAGAEEFIIKPLSDGRTISANVNEWIHLFKAIFVDIFEIPYSKDDQRVFHAQIKIFPDDTSANYGALWRIGPA